MPQGMCFKMIGTAFRIQDPFPIDHILHCSGKGRLTVGQSGINAIIGIEQVSLRIVPLRAFCSRLFLSVSSRMS